MTLEAKGRIKFNPDVKPGEPKYIIEAKQLGVVQEGSGDIEQMIDELTERVRRAISEEFCVAPSSVGVVGYSMGITFAVEGPVNRTLDEYVREQAANTDDTEMTIEFQGHEPVKTDMKRMALVTKAMEISAETGILPEKVIEVAKKKLAESKGGDAD